MEDVSKPVTGKLGYLFKKDGKLFWANSHPGPVDKKLWCWVRNGDYITHIGEAGKVDDNGYVIIKTV